jgi:hypothetical protein
VIDVVRKQSIQRKLLAIQEKVQSISGYNGLNICLDEYALLFNLTNSASYRDISAEIVAQEKYINALDSSLVGLFNQYLLLTLLCKFDIKNTGYSLPSFVESKYLYELDRVEGQLDKFDLNFYRFRNDKFLKDLAILCYRLVPVGAEFIVPYSGVPRTLLLKRGVIQFCKGLWTCSGSFYPYLELHAHTLSMDEFNPDGWLQTYMNLAEFLEKNPVFHGVVSSSWFLDPALGQLSPHLSYLRKIPEENGATILFNCWDDEGTSGALDKSESRRQLFRKGDYKPAIYTRIWPRKKLISFKNKMLSSI